MLSIYLWYKISLGEEQCLIQNQYEEGWASSGYLMTHTLVLRPLYPSVLDSWSWILHVKPKVLKLNCGLKPNRRTNFDNFRKIFFVVFVFLMPFLPRAYAIANLHRFLCFSIFKLLWFKGVLSRCLIHSLSFPSFRLV